MLKRVKRRYLAVQIDADGLLGSKEFLDAVWSAVYKLFGEYGASKTGMSLIDYDEGKKIAVLRVSHLALPSVRAALASMTKIGDKPAAVHVLFVSGTLKALRRNIAEHS